MLKGWIRPAWHGPADPAGETASPPVGALHIFRCASECVPALLKDATNGSRWLNGKEFTCSAGEPGLMPGSGRSLGERNGNLLQYS